LALQEGSLSASIESNERLHRQIDGLNLDRVNLEKVLRSDKGPSPEDLVFAGPSRQTSTSRKLAYSMHWYRKAEESAQLEDKLLAYWIAMEHLLTHAVPSKSMFGPDVREMNDLAVIRHLLPSTQFEWLATNPGWSLHSRLTNYFQFRQIDIPEALASRAQLVNAPPRTIYLRDFVRVLPDLSTALGDGWLGRRIEDISRFYTDPGNARSVLRSALERVKDDVVLIYRCRNSIVHNAESRDPSLQYYVTKCRHYCGTLIRHVSEAHCATGRSVSDILVGASVDQERTLEKLQTCKDALLDHLFPP